MNYIDAIILGIVEGLTEFLPISSTGHMIIAQKLLGLAPSEFLNTFVVSIQLGAIFSVVVLYWKRFFQSLDFYFKLFVAFLPAMVLGFLLNDVIDKLLESVLTVGISLFLGGIILLFVDKWFANKKTSEEGESISYKKAFTIGLFQVLAMIPGVSRSGATIVGGMAQKLSRIKAAEFSFFLAVPTMLAATAYKLLKTDVTLLKSNIGLLLVGNVVAFIVAILAIKTFIGLLNKYGFKSFGVYRIVVGLIIILLLMFHVDLAII